MVTRRVLAIALVLVLGPASAHAAVAFVARATNTAGAASVTVASVTIASGQIALVKLGWRHTGQTVTSVTFNGSTTGIALVTGSLQTTGSGDAAQATYIVTGQTGTADVVGTLSAGTVALNAMVETYSGVDAATPYTTVATANGSAATVSVTATSATDGLVVDNVVYRGGAALTVGAGQGNVSQLGTAGSSASMHSSTEAGAASVAMTWTGGSGATWVTVAVPLKAAAGGGGGTPPRGTLTGVLPD